MVLVLVNFSFLYGQDTLAIQNLKKEILSKNGLIRSFPDSAEQLFLGYIKSARALRSGENYARAYNNLVAAAFQDREGFERANQYSREAVDSIPLYLSKSSVLYADALSNRGAFLNRLGASSLAQRYLRKALAINLSADNPSRYILSTIYYALGGSYKASGDWLEAIRHYEKASSFYPTFPLTHASSGWAYLQLENFSSSKNAYRQILNHRDKRIQVDAALGMAECYVRETNWDSARYFLQLAELANTSGKPHKPQRVPEIMGEIYLANGQLEKALSAYQKAQATRAHLYPYRFQDLARGERQIGNLFTLLGQFENAHHHFADALTYLADDSYGVHELPDSQDILFKMDAIAVLSEKAQAYLLAFAVKPTPDALNKGLACGELAFQLFHVLRENRIEEANKLVLNHAMQDLFEGVLSTLYEFHQLTQDATYLQQALLWMERYQTGILYTERQRSQKWNNLPDSLRSQDEKYRIMIGVLGRKEAELKRKKADDAAIQEISEALFRERQAYTAFRDKLSAEWPSFSAVEEITENKLSRQLQSFPRQAASISYFWGKRAVFSVCFFQGKISFFKTLVSDSARKDLAELSSLIKQVDYAEATVKRYAAIASTLYQQWLAPCLEGISPTQLILIPDGELAFLPFEALLPQISDATAFRDLPYLARQTSVRYAHALSLLHIPPSVQASEPLLAVFAPAYSGNLTIPQNQEVPAALLAAVSGHDFSESSVATKAQFRMLSSQYAMIHLALHGQSDTLDASLAYLQFPLADSIDTRLYGHELYNLRLPNSLVSLAACEVGDGKFEAGEGLMSLSRAFRYAGATTVISSRWKADARVTDNIFPAFYHYLKKNKSSSDAFGQARRDFLEQTPPSLAHPHFWANFAHWGADYELPKRSYLPYIIISIFVLSIIFLIFFRKK